MVWRFFLSLLLYTVGPAMNSFWRSCLSHFEQQLPPQQFKTWIKPLRFHAAGNAVTLTAPNRFVLQWIRDHFLAEIQRLAIGRCGADVTIHLALAERETAPPAKLLVPLTPVSKPNTRDISRLNPEFSFETFVTGKANELARAAGIQVAERVGEAYNPLFIYGGVGLGKTHLIHAVGNLVLQRNPQSRIRYIHAEQ
ncbi:MAG: chromosomal replication initiator protein DnaA, partial [Betaproteobacteria bacterium]|nr:chromosomal replication initiator protein DnaA [Betaproteobacteria bacterium]